MSEHPILFSDPLVRAILAGTKTETRRLVRIAPGDVFTHAGRPCPGRDWPGSPACRPDDPPGTHHVHLRSGGSRHEYEMQIRCPYGAPGDTLWVREAWRPEELADGEDGIRYRADDGWTPTADTLEAATAFVQVYDWRRPYRWRPSIHMPRWASRLTLRVEEVRVERLQAITDEGALAEGVDVVRDGRRGAFNHLWDRINGERPGASWADDPWVWVVRFERVP